MENNHFKIIVPFYNVEKWIVKCLNSLLLQNYSNYECIIIDDGSTDKSYELASRLVKNNERFKLIKNSKNVGPLENAYMAVMKYATDLKDEDIVVILDGDDFFYGKDTLYKVNKFYNENDCWMSYGSYINLSDKKGGKFSKQVPHHIIESNSFRESEWCTSHLRSYKAFLVKELDVKDLKDDTGTFFRAAGDLAMMFPLLEMCGHKAGFINDVLYIWNDMSELNEHKNKRNLQIACEKNIRNKVKYTKLTNG